MATMGIVSALGDKWRTPMGGCSTRLADRCRDVSRFLRRALVDAMGQVLGLNTSALLATSRSRFQSPLFVASWTRCSLTAKCGAAISECAQPVRLPDRAQGANEARDRTASTFRRAGQPSRKGRVEHGRYDHCDGRRAYSPPRSTRRDSVRRSDWQSVEVSVLRGGQVQKLKVTVGEQS
jgi:hypothetical protein